MATMQMKPIFDRVVGAAEAEEPNQPKMPDLQQGYQDVAKDSQYTATTSPFDESKGVAGRVDSITDSGSSLMQRAASRATDVAQTRGLRNSTMAVQAGQAAMIDAAVPIATADANLYGQNQLANMQAQNQASAQNAQLRTSVGVQGLQAGEQSRQFGVEAGLKSRELGQNQSQFEQTIGLQRDQLDAQKEQFAAKFGLDAKQLDLQRDQLSQQDRQFLDELDLKRTQLDQQSQQFKDELENKRVLAQMDAASRKQLADIEAGYKTAIQSDQNIANAWGTMMQELGRIQANPDIEADAKKTLIDNTIGAFQSFTNFWSKSTNIDVGDLLKFGVTNTGGSGSGSTPPGPIKDDWRRESGYGG